MYALALLKTRISSHVKGGGNIVSQLTHSIASRSVNVFYN